MNCEKKEHSMYVCYTRKKEWEKKIMWTLTSLAFLTCRRALRKILHSMYLECPVSTNANNLVHPSHPRTWTRESLPSRTTTKWCSTSSPWFPSPPSPRGGSILFPSSLVSFVNDVGSHVPPVFQSPLRKCRGDSDLLENQHPIFAFKKITLYHISKVQLSPVLMFQNELTL